MSVSVGIRTVCLECGKSLDCSENCAKYSVLKGEMVLEVGLCGNCSPKLEVAQNSTSTNKRSVQCSSCGPLIGHVGNYWECDKCGSKYTG